MLLTALHTFLLVFAPLQGLSGHDAATVDAPTPAASTLGGTPTLWISIPSQGETLDLVVLVGTNFGDFPIPMFGIYPSIPVFTLNSPDLPLLGSISATLTAVPFYLFGGNVDLTILNGFQSSNAIDFRLL
ncbi:MAG: hypothetical protein ACYTEP_07830 [Planctomycetota bacterium]|jgi:hypothetical protein